VSPRPIRYSCVVDATPALYHQVMVDLQQEVGVLEVREEREQRAHRDDQGDPCPARAALVAACARGGDDSAADMADQRARADQGEVGTLQLA
jgi:hypothetical protein